MNLSSVVGFRQLQVRGGMILSLKDNVKRCCIAVIEVSFRAVALLFWARLISLKMMILLPVIFTSFNLLISCQNISDSLVVKNAQHSAPWIYHDNQENGWIPIKLLWFASFFDPLYERTDNFLMSMSLRWWWWKWLPSLLLRELHISPLNSWLWWLREDRSWR